MNSKENYTDNVVAFFRLDFGVLYADVGAWPLDCCEKHRWKTFECDSTPDRAETNEFQQ